MDMQGEGRIGTVEMRTDLSATGRQFLSFMLGDESYGVDILRVQEIKGYTAVTHIPNTPAFIKGVLNLRGTIVPIIDLRTKFGMPSAEPTPFTVIVVVVVRDKVMGLVVDSVSDVLDIDPKEVQPAPQFGGNVDTSFLQSMAKVGDRLVAMLDIDRVLADQDVAQAAAVVGGN